MSVLHPKSTEEAKKLIKEKKELAPKFEGFSKSYTDVVFVKVDVDDSNFNEFCKENKIRAMPTFKFFKGGSKVAELIGANVQQLENLIKEHK